MNRDADLKKLYAQIPAFECKPGCHDCCGPVPIAKAEWKAIKMHPRHVMGSCLDCSYQVDDSCSIYKDRPFLCRLFGATNAAKMKCPHGCGPEVPLSERQADMLTKKYLSIMGMQPAAMTTDIDMVAVKKNSFR